MSLLSNVYFQKSYKDNPQTLELGSIFFSYDNTKGSERLKASSPAELDH